MANSREINRCFRWTALLILVVITLGALSPAGTAAVAVVPVPEISVILDGTAVNFPDVKPRVQNGRTLVPLRGVFEALKAEVLWDDRTGTITVRNAQKTIIMRPGQMTVTVNGQTVTIDVPPAIENGRTLVPLRFLIEHLGSDVAWDQATMQVRIQSRPAVPPEVPPEDTGGIETPPVDPGSGGGGGTGDGSSNPAPVEPETKNVVTIIPPTVSPKVGETFEIIIEGRELEDLCSFQLSADYSSSLAQFQDLRVIILKSDGYGTFDFPLSDQGSGRISFVSTRLRKTLSDGTGEFAGVNGSGNILKVQLKATASGTLGFHIIQFDLYNSTGSPIPVTLVNSSIEIRID